MSDFTFGDVVSHNNGKKGGSLNGIFRVVDIQGNVVCLRAFNESGTYSYFDGFREDFHRVV
jgi:hypothetical protein